MVIKDDVVIIIEALNTNSDSLKKKMSRVMTRAPFCLKLYVYKKCYGDKFLVTIIQLITSFLHFPEKTTTTDAMVYIAISKLKFWCLLSHSSACVCVTLVIIQSSHSTPLTGWSMGNRASNRASS